MSPPVARSPLAHRAPLTAAGSLHLGEVPARDLFILRGARSVIGARVGRVLGGLLPERVRGTVTTPAASVLWLAPDEWLLIAANGQHVATELGDTLNGLHHQLTDVSDYYTGIGLSGPQAREALAKLVVIDVHPDHFHAGEAVATVGGKAQIWLWLRLDGPEGAAFELFVRRSHADYLWCLLAEAGREWGLPAQEPIGRVPLHLPHLAG